MGTTRKNERKRLVTAVVCYVLFLSTTVLAQAAEYEYVEILDIIPTGINNSGVVVGNGDSVLYKERSFFTYDHGELNEYPIPRCTFARASAISDSGAIVGVKRLFAIPLFGPAYIPIGEKIFIYTEGKYTLVPPPPGYMFIQYFSTYFEALDINNDGAVVGTIGVRPFIRNYIQSWTKGFMYKEGKFIELLPEGWFWSMATGINNNDVVVGYGQDSNTQFKVFIYDGNYTEMTLPKGFTDMTVTGIDDSGTVVGNGVDPEGDRYEVGFICKDGTCSELVLPILPEGWDTTTAIPYHISPGGKVMGGNGFGFYADGAHWFIYSDGEYQFLTSPPGLYYPEVTGINDDGVIVGFAMDRPGDDLNRKLVGFIAKINMADSD